MLIHCSEKFAATLSNVSKEPIPDNSILGSWHGHAFRLKRRQCVMFCHDITRYILFMHGWTRKESINFDFWFTDLFVNTMLKMGYPIEILEKGISMLNSSRFDRNTNRSVQGTMRQAILELEYLIEDCPSSMELPMYSTAVQLNERPVTTKGMKNNDFIWPVAAMHMHIDEASQSQGLKLVQ